MSEIERFFRMVKHCEEQKPCDDCPMTEECTKYGMPSLTKALQDEILAQDAALKVIVECVEGTVKHYIYFCMKERPKADKLPQDGLLAFVPHDERRYIARIDDLAWGLAVYKRELMPWEIARYGLRANPRG